jgi:uncharacterized PurR-regulated membrane protein YhhQ (DUF165 family)
VVLGNCVLCVWQLADGAKYFSVGTINYIYKFIVAIALTPLLYVAHYFIDRYLGQDVADRMAEKAGEDLSIF